jgi:hypothetical protein
MTTKLQAFIKRNRIRNADLYSDDKIELIDYVYCPLSGCRMVNMTKYITDTLDMTHSAYDALYPNNVKVAQSLSKRIQKGVQAIDPETGLTKYELGQRKARETLATPDENGETGYDKKGKKTKATHLSKVDENGRNGYQRQAHGRVTTILENGLTVEENAHIKRQETINQTNVTGTGGASELSKIELKPILEYLDSNDIKYYFDKTEYAITDRDTGKNYSFDLTISQFKMAIEYQSKAWHSNPAWSDEKWNNWKQPLGVSKTPEACLEYDYTKAKSLYKERGYITYYVWQDSSKADIEGILCLLETMNTKY